MYPFYGQLAEHGARTVVVMEGHCQEAVKLGINALLARIPSSIVLFQADGGCLQMLEATDVEQHQAASA